jgi:hypothetical protein
MDIFTFYLIFYIENEIGETCNALTEYDNYIGNYEGEKLRWRHRHVWEVNIEMNAKEIGCVGVN